MFNIKKSNKAMKKTYQSPAMTVVMISVRNVLQQASPSGVETGGTPNNAYSENDVTYSRRGSSLWDEDED